VTVVLFLRKKTKMEEEDCPFILPSCAIGSRKDPAVDLHSSSCIVYNYWISKCNQYTFLLSFFQKYLSIENNQKMCF